MNESNEKIIEITNYSDIKHIAVSKWMPIIETLIKIGENNATLWMDEVVANDKDILCGIRGEIDGYQYSIISHKYSYGGESGLFEVMPGIGENFEDVTGWLTAEEVVSYLKEGKFKSKGDFYND